MATVQISLPALHPAQQRIVAEARRFNVICAGRRTGKTLLGVDRLAQIAIAGHPTAWAAPNFKQMMEVWRTLQTILEPLIAEKNNSEMRIGLRTQGSITLYSLDSADTADAIRGRAFALAVVDECAMVRELMTIWESTIRPCLTDLQGSAWFLSTPKGFGPFKVLWDRGADPSFPDWASWRLPTASNPYIAASEIAAAKQELSERTFSQEFAGNWENWEGSVFRAVEECATARRQDEAQPGHSYIFGVDWAKSHDFTAIAVVDATTRELVHLDRFNKIDFTFQRGRLLALFARFQPDRIIAEANSIGEPMCEALERDGLQIERFITSNRSKAEIVENLSLAFERGDIAIIPDPVLLNELQSFEATQLAGGLLRYAGPPSGHDDTVIAACLAWSPIRPAPRDAIYANLLADALYSSDVRPTYLDRPHFGEAYIAVQTTGDSMLAVRATNDGGVLWIDAEHHSPTTPADVVGALARDFGDPHSWPAILLDSNCQTLISRFRQQGVWVCEIDVEHEEGARKIAALLMTKRIRINKQCEQLRRALSGLTWSDVSKNDADPLRLFAERLPNWWLA